MPYLSNLYIQTMNTRTQRPSKNVAQYLTHTRVCNVEGKYGADAKSGRERKKLMFNQIIK